MAFAVIFAIVVLIWPRKIFSIYTTDDGVLDVMQWSSPYFAICVLLEHSQLCLSGVVVGLGQQHLSKYNILMYFVIGIPIGVLLTFYFELYEGGFWIGLAVAFLCVNILYFGVYRYTDYEATVENITKRNEYKLINDEEEPAEPQEAEQIIKFRSLPRSGSSHE